MSVSCMKKSNAIIGAVWRVPLPFLRCLAVLVATNNAFPLSQSARLIFVTLMENYHAPRTSMRPDKSLRNLAYPTQ